jgi:hypothetical protein
MKTFTRCACWSNTGEDTIFTYVMYFEMKLGMLAQICTDIQELRSIWVLVCHTIIIVIDVTSLLPLWSCRINHNISATRTQPILADRQTDGRTDTLLPVGLGNLKLVPPGKQNLFGPTAREKLSPTSMCFLVPKKHLSKILWCFQNIMMLLKGYCRIEKIIVSLSLSNLFLPNSNSFPTNSNIAETATF